MKQTVLVITCEHAVNVIPPQFTSLFDDPALFESPRAYDQGASHIARTLAIELACDYTESTVSRLLVDCNRSTSHGRCFTSWTQELPEDDKQSLLEQYYLPFRNDTHAVIKKHIVLGKQVLHLSVHTFAPQVKGRIRNAGIGLLYDYHRHGEKEVARIWHAILSQQTPSYRVRMNYPFSAHADAFIHTLRQAHTEQEYLGLILECNQALIQTSETLDELCDVLSISLKELMTLL